MLIFLIFWRFCKFFTTQLLTFSNKKRKTAQNSSYKFQAVFLFHHFCLRHFIHFPALSHSGSYCRANGTAFPSPLQKICAHRCTEKFSDVIAVSDHTPSVLPLLQRQQRLSRLPAKGFPLQYYECIRQFSCEILYPGPNNLLFSITSSISLKIEASSSISSSLARWAASPAI